MATTQYAEEDISRALGKWERVKDGAADVVVDDETLDILSAHFKDQDGTEADVYFRHTSSPANPTGVGLRDRYILKLSEKGRDMLAEHSPVKSPRL